MEKKVITVADVGYTWSSSDMKRKLEVAKFIAKNYKGTDLDGKVVHDSVQICKGRDFLAEDKQYDIVVVHFVFQSNLRCQIDEHSELMMSPFSSWSNWRKRLVQTNAKLIFPFGGYSEVSGSFLCPMDGYRLYEKVCPHPFRVSDTQTTDADFWVFVREDLSQPKDDTLELIGNYNLVDAWMGGKNVKKEK